MSRIPMTRKPVARRMASVLIVPMTAALLVGCSTVQEAVDGAQGAVDAAQSLLAVPEQIGQACDTAVAALAPDLPATEAAAALKDANALLDAGLGGAASLPGVADLREAFVSAGESLAAGIDARTLESTRAALDAACSAFPGR